MRFDIQVIGELNVDPKLKTSISTVLTKQAGDRAIFTYPGSIGTLRSDPIGQSIFRYGFLYGYLNGESFSESLKLGCACGSLSTRSVGSERTADARRSHER